MGDTHTKLHIYADRPIYHCPLAPVGPNHCTGRLGNCNYFFRYFSKNYYMIIIQMKLLKFNNEDRKNKRGLYKYGNTEKGVVWLDL